MTKARSRQSILPHDMVTLPAVTDTYVFAIDLVRPGFLGTVPVFLDFKDLGLRVKQNSVWEAKITGFSKS